MTPYALLRPVMRAWYSGMLAHAPLVASPRPGSFVGATDPHADRVLLVGNGPSHGWGVLTHELSLVGHLASAVRARTGREIGVEYVGDERMTARSAQAWVGDAAAQGHDLAVVVLGMNDALRLTPVQQFDEDYRALVAHLRATLPGHARIVLVTLPRVTNYRMAQGWLGRVAERHASRLSDVIRDVAAETPGASAVEAPEEHFEPDAPLGSRAFFADLAQQLGAHVVPVLETARAERQDEPHAFVLSAARVLAAAGDPALHELVTDAQRRFGVAVASVNLVDGDRIWSAALAGSLPVQMPTPLVYCGIVTSTDAELVVPDRHRDRRFDGNPILDVVGLPFYTGVPLHDSAGTVVGALCMLDDRPHDAGYVPLPEMRQLASAAEARIRERLAAASGEVEQPA